MPNEQPDIELQALRKENARLKAELSEARLQSSGKNELAEDDLLLKRELHLKEMQLNSAYKLTNISAWSYDFETGQLNPSEQLRNIWKPPAKNVLEAFLKRVHPDDRDKILDAINNPVQCSTLDYSYRILGDDGNTHYVLSRSTVECDEKGKPVIAHGISWDITEKKRHEEQNLQTEKNLRSFFEMIGLGPWAYIVDADEIYVSEKIRRFAKLKHNNEIVKKEDFLGKIHFQDLERIKLSFAKVLTGESPVYDCTFRLLRKDKKYVWVLSRGVPIFDNKSRVYKVLGCIEDLSESQRYNVIKERLNFMQHIADSLPIPIYYKDMDGRYIGCNEAFEKFVKNIGFEDGIAIGSTIRDLHKGNNFKLGIQLYEDEKAFLANPGESFEKTYNVKSILGDKWFVVNKKGVLYDSENKPKYLVGGILDITSLKLAEERLRQTTERLNTTLNAMSEMIMCFDKKLNLQWANRAAHDALGGENKRFVKRNWHEIWEKGENLDSDEHPVLRVLNNSEDFSSAKMKTRDGRIYEVRAYPVRSKDKKVSGVVEVSLDITEHEATKIKAQIRKEQLMLADKMKTLGILISGVAHEINNPNNFISINAALLQRIWEDSKPGLHEQIKNIPDFKLGNIPGDKLEESIDDLLFGIKDGSERIRKIIDSLKAYIRNVPGDIKAVFDLNSAIENALFLLKNQIMRATDNFSIYQKYEKLPVEGVQQKIEQVIINVLQNACQALTSREQSIQVDTLVEPQGEWVTIKITDTGSGIKPENFNYITDPFFTTRRETGGTGLGLSISSSILDDHKGRFKFVSEPDKGTSVEIILPLVVDGKVSD